MVSRESASPAARATVEVLARPTAATTTTQAIIRCTADDDKDPSSTILGRCAAAAKDSRSRRCGSRVVCAAAAASLRGSAPLSDIAGPGRAPRSEVEPDRASSRPDEDRRKRGEREKKGREK